MQTNINLYDIWKMPLYHNPNAFFDNVHSVLNQS